MNDKKHPEQCEAKVCCKASASLQKEIDVELKAPDKSLASLTERMVVAASGASIALEEFGRTLVSLAPDIAEDDDDENPDS